MNRNKKKLIEVALPLEAIKKIFLNLYRIYIQFEGSISALIEPRIETSITREFLTNGL